MKAHERDLCTLVVIVRVGHYGGVIQKLIKMRQDSIADAEKAGRKDVADREKGEMEVLQGYLPQMMSREEIETEAKAMIATWRDSWFEEGTRVFYIVPSRMIDSVLPLQIQPAPAQVSRVFVGRMEIITPAMEQDVRDAVTRNDRATLGKYGRFLEPIAERIGLKSPVLDAIYSEAFNQAACRQ